MAVDRTTREWSEKFEEPGIRVNIKLSFPSDVNADEYVKGVKKLLKYLEAPNQETLNFGEEE